METVSRAVEAKRTGRRTRWAGGAAVVGAAGLLAASVADAVTDVTLRTGDPAYVAAWGLFVLGAALLLVGLVGAHAAYGDDYGRLGLAGAVVAGLGFLSTGVGSVMNAVYSGPAGDALPAGAAVFVGLLVAAFGSALLGAALWQSRDAVRAGAVLTVVPLVLVVSVLTGEAVAAVAGFDALWVAFLLAFAAGWMLLGERMRTGAVTSARETSSPLA